MTAASQPAERPVLKIAPQPGPQQQFFESLADIVIYGGAAGGGKSWSLLVEPLRHISNRRFGAVIFRRTSKQVFNEGGLWDEASELYPKLGAKSNMVEATWTFPAGASVSFAHLQHEKDIYIYQGAQIALAEFDELTHFTKKQFFYILSRLRSMSGVRPYVRCSTNPDADSWVAELIAWWIDQDEFLPDGVTPNRRYGLPIPERAAVVRYFLKDGDRYIWGATREEVYEQRPAGKKIEMRDVKSLTFIPAALEDNQILVQKDPDYRGNLLMQDAVEQARLLDGNWKTRKSAGMYFKRTWVEVVDVVPAQARRIRYWERAATEPNPDNPDPDWTRGVLLAQAPDGVVYVEDVIGLRGAPGEVEKLILNTAKVDRERYPDIIIGIEQDPAAAGKAEANSYLKLLAGFDVRMFPVSGKGQKVTRFSPFSAQAYGRNVKVKQGLWNQEWFEELEAFPTVGVHDDQVDATGGAYNALNAPSKEEKPRASAQDVKNIQTAFMRRLKGR
ncbi:phage terminase large subunit [Deinococcus sp. 6GRE01]|uniref:phage terminase large subunit n=1 Tax=Deinococcus sp. 6GRE01 TaxID=2745873 RepID=UPI002105412B|nr:phage terminase large subunit [Deinococcus sp. 6GRE01]MCD0156274.1 phage terminase large subunit [Deinococcus sp. 6GRE01]